MVSISTLEHLDFSVPPDVARKMMRQMSDFQLMPEAAAEALQLVKDPSCEISKIAKTVERNVELASSILSISNNAMYAPIRPILAVRDAVVQIGFRQCQNLIHACCAKSLIQGCQVASRAVRTSLLNHSLMTAGIATHMNRMLDLGFQGEEFTAGLMHDLGRLLLAGLFPEQFDELQKQSVDGCEDLEQEQAMFGTDHAILGCFFAVEHRIPDQLAEAVRYHHEPEMADLNPRLTAITSIADCLATASEDFDIRECRGLETFRENFDEDVFLRLVSSYEQIIAQARVGVSSV